MEFATPVQVVLEMEPAEATISGRISVEGASPTGFFGWLELIDRLDRAARQAADAPQRPGIDDEGVQGD